MAVRRQLHGTSAGAIASLAVAACMAAPSARELPRTAVPAVAATATGVRSSVDAPDAVDAAPPPAAPEPLEELLATASVLAHAEEHAEALRALERSAFADDPQVAMARADLLRDLGRRHEALAAMRNVRDRLGAGAVDPRVLFELAELERLEGERAAARRTLASIRELHGAAGWTRANAARLALVDGQLAAAEAVRAMAARDLLGNLRGAPDPAERLAALRALLAGAYGDADDAASVQERAIAIAVGDDAEAVRLAGVRAWTFDDEVGRDFVALALVDASALVRRAAVAHAGKLPASTACALLFARLQQESDEAVFLALHDGLRAAAGGGAAITPLDAATAAGRATVVAQWRRAGFAEEAP